MKLEKLDESRREKVLELHIVPSKNWKPRENYVSMTYVRAIGKPTSNVDTVCNLNIVKFQDVSYSMTKRTNLP